MLKVLLNTEVLIEALRKNNATCRKAIEKCIKSPNIQAWVLASSVSELVKKGISATGISDALRHIAKIPVNHYLTQKALHSSLQFDRAFELAAARVFKLSMIVKVDVQASNGDIKDISTQDFLELDESDLPGNINFMDLTLPVHAIFNQVDGWYMEIIQNTAFAGGNHVAEFEKEFAEYCQTRFAVGTSNGTDALLFCLLALGIGPGDEVITVPNTFIATTEAISQAGGTPVFVDVRADSYNMDTNQIEEKITENTKVILPVHLYGQIADMDAILAIAQKHKIKVLEDACQAHGAVYKGKRAGSIGDAAAFSMYPGKNLGAFGEAGCVVTSDPEINRAVRLLRDHGQNQKYYHEIEGYNGRMDNLQAASLRAKLPLMDAWNDLRRNAARWYQKYLRDIPQVVLPKVVIDESAHVFHVYVILVSEPREMHEYLKSKGIFTAFHYPVPLHKQNAYKQQFAAKQSYPVTEECTRKLLTLPMFPEITEKQIMRICGEIKRFYD